MCLLSLELLSYKGFIQDSINYNTVFMPCIDNLAYTEVFIEYHIVIWPYARFNLLLKNP